MVEGGVAIGDVIANGTNLARDLSNQPPNHLTPTMLADKAVEVANEVGLKCEVFDLRTTPREGVSHLTRRVSGKHRGAAIYHLGTYPRQ